MLNQLSGETNREEKHGKEKDRLNNCSSADCRGIYERMAGTMNAAFMSRLNSLL